MSDFDYIKNAIKYIASGGTLRKIADIASKAAERGHLDDFIRDFWDMVRDHTFKKIKAQGDEHEKWQRKRVIATRSGKPAIPLKIDKGEPLSMKNCSIDKNSCQATKLKEFL